jgi:outer membrane protein insertion porin family
MNKYIFAILFSVLSAAAMAQVPGQGRLQKSIPADSLSYLNPREYIIGGVSVAGVKYLDKDILLQISKLNKGDRITLPGDASAKVIKDLWDKGFLMM